LYFPHKKLLLLDLFSVLMMSLIELAFPIITAKIIDDVIPACDLNLLIWLCGITVAAYLLKYIFEYVVTYYGHKLGLSIEVDLRSNLYAHLQSLSFSYFDNQRTGHLISRLMTDIFDISEFSHHGPENLFVATIILIGSFCVMISASVPLTVIIFLIVPIMLFSAVRNNLKWENAYMDVKKQYAEMSAHIEDSFSGIRVVKAFTNEDYEIERFGETSHTYKDVRKLTYRYMARFVSKMHFFTGLLNIVVIFVGGYLIYSGKITVGVLIEFLMFVNIFVQPVRQVTAMIEDYQKAVTGFKRCQEVLALEPAIADEEDSVEANNIQGDLLFAHVNFGYHPDDLILEDFNLHISKANNRSRRGERCRKNNVMFVDPTFL
jgi:ATP-binding cassette subfamily B protein